MYARTRTEAVQAHTDGAIAAFATPPLRRPTRMAMNIPTDLLRSFLAIVDSGSMAQATEVIFLTQSALSLQMKRLEDLLQQRMFQRHGRSLTLTAAGEELVGLARELLELNDRIVSSLGAEIDPQPLQLGLVGDFADTLLPGVLAAFARQHPRQRLRLTVDGSAGLIDAFERSQLDVALCMGHHRELRRGSSRVVAQAQMVWSVPHIWPPATNCRWSCSTHPAPFARRCWSGWSCSSAAIASCWKRRICPGWWRPCGPGSGYPAAPTAMPRPWTCRSSRTRTCLNFP